MSSETVKIYVYDQDNEPLPGVLVRFFDAAGAVFITQQQSSMVGDDAVAEVTLEGDDPVISYTVRLSKTGAAFDGSLGNMSKSPQLISVQSPPVSPNNFDVWGETFVRSVSPDPRMCRCGGFFRDIAGRPLVGLPITIINEFAPVVMDGRAVLGSEVCIETDKEGYVEVDLFRNGKYIAWVPGVEVSDDLQGQKAIVYPRYMVIPDRGSMNLPDLLFPIVASVDFGVPSVSVGVLVAVQLSPVVTASDGRILAGAAGNDVIYTSSDPSVVGVSTQLNTISIVGIQPGTATIQAVRRDQSVVQIPATTISGQPITVVVS
jgi:hypothetical protein